MNKMRERGYSSRKHCVGSVDQLCRTLRAPKNAAVLNKATVRQPQRRHLAEFPTQPRQSVRPTPPANPVGRATRAKALAHYSSKDFYCAPRCVNLFIYTASRGACLGAIWLSARAHGI